MADSVRERIMKNIQAALEGITVGNGYANTLNRVERFLQAGQTYTPPMAVVIEGDDDVIGEQPLGYVSRNLSVGVVLSVQQDSELDSRSASEVMNSLVADVQKKMQEDYRRGNLAVNTEEVSVSNLDAVEGQPDLSCAVAYRIQYRHALADPTVAA